MNPQIRFGEDLMSRVSYVMMNPGGDKEMTAVIREALEHACAPSCDGSPDRAHRYSGNRPGRQSGHASSVARHRSDGAWRRALCAGDGACHHLPGARARSQTQSRRLCYVLPCIAGHVGADTAGVVLSEEPHDSEDIMLVVDVGTNAEIVLGSKARCSPAHRRRGLPSKARRFPAASAPRRAPSSASASILSPSSRDTE